MRREWDWKNISWKSKKRMAEMLCVFVVVCSMVLSLCVQNRNSIQQEESKAAGRYQMENDGQTVSLKLDSKQVSEEEKDMVVESQAQEEAKAESKDETDSSEKQTASKVLQKEQNVSEQSETQVYGLEPTDNNSKDAAKNKVVQNNMAQRGDGKNAVVKNPAPLTLVSTIFENHGQIPELGETEMKYQYPVEIGYAADKNYDGKQDRKDSILNIVMDTIPETENEEDSDAEKSDKEEEKDSDGGHTDTEKDTEKVTSENETENASEKKMEEGENPEESETSTEAVKEKEQDKREKFKSEIWKKLFMTEPVEVQTEEQLKVEEEKKVQEDSESKEESSESPEEVTEKKETETKKEKTEEETGEEAAKDNSAEESENQQEDDVKASEEDRESSTDNKDEKSSVKIVEADAGYYIISGKMRDGKDAFVSDIVIKPSGVKGFNQVRIGKDGEFTSSIRITEDAVNKDVELYFTDGEKITKGTVFTYTKDTHIPEMKAEDEKVKILPSAQGAIYCTNVPQVDMKIDDGEKETCSGIEKISCVYGDKIACVVDSLEEPKVTLPQDFFGRVLLNCEDKAGNASDIISQYYLVEQNVPKITFSDSEICTVPYTLWVDVEDTGHIISGIDNMECTINGEPYEIADLKAQENVQLTDDLEVPSKVGFSIPFEQEGSYQIELRVTDHAGNVVTVEKNIEVTQPDMVAVYMPKEFTIHIDPQQLLGREQIFSDNITLENVSNVDVMVQIEDIAVRVNDEVSDAGVLKDCELYLVAPDTGEKIKLKKGKNKKVYSYCLPMNATGDITNLHFVGETTEGSDAMWKSSDISIDVKLSFGKWQ